MVKDILDKWMADRKSDLIGNYKSKGLKASGGFETAVRIETKEFESYMFAPPYVGVMVTGRKPNRNQSPEALKKFVGWAGSTFLKKWVSDKGISVSPFAVAWKIAREGVQVPNSKNDGRLLTDTFTQSRYEELYKSITSLYIVSLKSDIQKIWQ